MRLLAKFPRNRFFINKTIMKKIIILGLFVFLASVSVAFGQVVVRQWADTKWLEDGKTQDIYSTILKRDHIQVVKFQDENTICYIAYTVYAELNRTDSPSMQCHEVK